MSPPRDRRQPVSGQIRPRPPPLGIVPFLRTRPGPGNHVYQDFLNAKRITFLRHLPDTHALHRRADTLSGRLNTEQPIPLPRENVPETIANRKKQKKLARAYECNTWAFFYLRRRRHDPNWQRQFQIEKDRILRLKHARAEARWAQIRDVDEQDANKIRYEMLSTLRRRFDPSWTIKTLKEKEEHMKEGRMLALRLSEDVMAEESGPTGPMPTTPIAQPLPAGSGMNKKSRLRLMELS